MSARPVTVSAVLGCGVDVMRSKAEAVTGELTGLANRVVADDSDVEPAFVGFLDSEETTLGF